MRRWVWVAVGAAGGIWAYRRGQQVLADTRERGVVLSAQQVGLSAAQAVTQARVLASGALAAAQARGRSAQPSVASTAPRAVGSAAAQAMSRSHEPPSSYPREQ